MSDGDVPALEAVQNAPSEPERYGARVKQQAREAREAAIAAVAAGDYLRARKLDAEVAGLVQDCELGHEAAAEAASLAPDPWAVIVGVSGIVLVCLAWLHAVW